MKKPLNRNPVVAQIKLAKASIVTLEAELLRRAIARTDAEILRVLGVLDAMRAKQIARQHELAKQLARLARES